jgi:hypothetical protein
MRTNIKTVIDRATAYFEPLRVAAKETYDAVVKKKNEVVKPAEQALAEVNKKLAEYVMAQEQERRRLEQIETDRANRETEKLRQREVKKLERQGYDAESVQLIATQVAVPQVREIAPTYEAGAISTRVAYEAEVVDLLALVKFVAKNKRYLYLLEANKTEVNKLARSMREQLDIPGLKLNKKTTIASNSRRS